MSRFPESWCLEKLGDVMDVQGGSQPPKSHFIYEPKEGYVQLLQIRDFGDKPVPTYVPKNKVTKFCKEDDVLIARYGASLGRIVTGLKGAYNVALAKTIFDNNLLYKRYVFYLLQTSVLQVPLKMISRSAQNGFAKHEIAHVELPIPPLQEQKRIVAKIEELFSELDKGIENLKTAREQLKVYRQAILKHAFEGKLTANWREKNKDKLESADKLLERIKEEREAVYQQQLEEWQAAVKEWEENGKANRKPQKPRKQLNPVLSDKNNWVDLPFLPEDWSWTTLTSITNEITDGDHQAPPQTSAGIPFIVISNIKNNKVDFSQTKFVPRPYYDEISINRKPQKGDILYTVTGSFGIPALIDSERDFCFQRHIGLIKPLTIISNRFLCYVLQGPLVYAQAQAVATGTAQKTVPLSGLRNFSIPLVSPHEQTEIIQKLDAVFSEIDSLETEVEDQLQKAYALRQSILKRAFSGKLVAQDPKDEPASVLLERIKAEKNESPKRKKKVA